MKLKLLGLIFIVPMIILLLVAFYNIGFKNSLICIGVFIVMVLCQIGIRLLIEKDF